MAVVAERDETERWFVRRGIPHFIDHYSATHDIFTRAAPLLTLIFLLEILNALNYEFPWWGNVLSFLGAAALMLGGVVVVNRRRGRRNLQRPDTIGPLELAVFVLLPPVVPLVFGGQGRQALETAIANLVILGLIYVVTSYALISMTRWALLQMTRQFRQLADLLARSLPLLLIFATFLFLNEEVWRISGSLTRTSFSLLAGLLVGVGSLFLFLRIPRELRALFDFRTWSDVRAAAAGTPVAEVATEGLESPPVMSPLSTRARVNVVLVVFFTEAVQVLLVTAAVGLFYVAFGAFILSGATMSEWADRPVNVLFDLSVRDQPVLITEELLRAATFVALFSGLQFTVSAVTDATFREEFFDSIVREIRTAFAVRALYLARVVSITS